MEIITISAETWDSKYKCTTSYMGGIVNTYIFVHKDTEDVVVLEENPEYSTFTLSTDGKEVQIQGKEIGDLGDLIDNLK